MSRLRKLLSPLRCRRHRGFTLVELLVAVVIVGILAAVALPSFVDSIRKGRRSEAFAALSSLQQAEEKYRASYSSYAGSALLTTATTATPPGLGQATTTPSGYYTVAITSATDTGYVATATAVSGTTQANDTNCTLLVVSMEGGNVGYGAGSTSLPLTDTNKCWAR